MIRKFFLITAALILSTSSIYADPGLRQLTWQYEPETWQLSQLTPFTSFSPFVMTEFSIPIPTKLKISIYKINESTSVKKLIYNVVKPDKRVYGPAVYRFDWSCMCDSLGLPLSESGVYQIFVQAFNPNDLGSIIFKDSLEIFLPGGWKKFSTNENQYKVILLDNITIRNKRDLLPTDVACIYSAIKITDVRYLYSESTKSLTDVVVKLKNTGKYFSKDPFRQDARGYICVIDSTSESGFKIKNEIAPFRGIHSVWELSLNKEELLMIDCVSHWPIVIDGQGIIEAINNQYETENN
jgi:hypothetical protein